MRAAPTLHRYESPANRLGLRPNDAGVEKIRREEILSCGFTNGGEEDLFVLWH